MNDFKCKYEYELEAPSIGFLVNKLTFEQFRLDENTLELQALGTSNCQANSQVQ